MPQDDHHGGAHVLHPSDFPTVDAYVAAVQALRDRPLHAGKLVAFTAR